MDSYISLLLVLVCRLLFPAAALAVDVQIEPARYWVETLNVHFLHPLLFFLLCFLNEIPIFFFIKTLFFLIIWLFRRCRVIFNFLLLWFDYRFSLCKRHWLLLYSFPCFLNVIINYLGLLALKRHVLQYLKYLIILLCFT